MSPRIVLVKPPEVSPFSFGTFSLGVLAAAVRHLADVSILDATEMTPEAATAEILSHQPDLIGITVMGLPSVQPVAEFVRMLCSACDHGTGAANAPIVVGGHGASMVPAPLLEAGADAVVIGEGESVFCRIVHQGIRAGAPGVACVVGGSLVVGPPQHPVDPLDDLLLPARDLMPPPANDIHLMETSRGCPHACAFCETTRFYGQRWRPKSPERVAAEVRNLIDQHGAWIIHFADDNFAASPARVRRICETLRTQELPAFFVTAARADDLVAEPDLLPLMAAARILHVTVGVETLDPGLASRVGKAIPLPTYQELFTRMRALGMFSVASMIVGLPGEEPALRSQAVALALEAGPDSAHFLPFLPLAGTPLAAGQSGLEPHPRDVQDASAFTVSYFQHPGVRARLEAATRDGNIRGLLARATLQKRLGQGMPHGLDIV